MIFQIQNSTITNNSAGTGSTATDAGGGGGISIPVNRSGRFCEPSPSKARFYPGNTSTAQTVGRTCRSYGGLSHRLQQCDWRFRRIHPVPRQRQQLAPRGVTQSRPACRQRRPERLPTPSSAAVQPSTWLESSFPGSLSTDQRGVTRSLDAATDIGAFELDSGSIPTAGGTFSGT